MTMEKDFSSQHQVLWQSMHIQTCFWDSLKKKISTLFTFPYIQADWCVAQTLFFFPTQSTRWSKLSRYFEHVSGMHGKFAKGFEGRLSAYCKTWECVHESSKLNWNNSFYQNLNFLYFPCNIIWLQCRISHLYTICS